MVTDSGLKVYGDLGALVWVVASNAPAKIRAWAISLQTRGYLVWVCDGVADNVEIQAAFDAGNAFGIPFSVYFSPGDYSIAAQVNGYSNMHLIFDRAKFVAAFAGIIFRWPGNTVNISSEGTVEFDGNAQATYAVACFVWEAVAPDKNTNWKANTTVYGCTTGGLLFQGRHIRIGELIGINQVYALRLSTWEDVEIDELRFIYTASIGAPSGIAVEPSADNSVIKPKHLIFKKVWVDCGHIQSHGFSVGYANRWIEDVQFHNVYIKDAPKVDESNFMVGWARGIKIINFFGDGANFNIYNARDISIKHGKVWRTPHGGMSIHAAFAGQIDHSKIILEDIMAINCGHDSGSGWPKVGIEIFGSVADNTWTQDVLLENIVCYDDQNGMTSLLTADAALGQPDIVVTSLLTNREFFYVGQLVTISDDTPDTENNIIASIDWATRTITMVNILANNYTVLQNARVTGRQTQDYGVLIDGQIRRVKFGSNMSLLGNRLGGIHMVDVGHGLDLANIRGNIQARSVVLDLSGGATDIVTYLASVPAYLIGYDYIEEEGSSVNAGVVVRVGRLQADSTFDDDYYDTITSEVSRVKGYSREYSYDELLQHAIAEGESITVGTAGLKVGSGEVRIILQIVEMVD